MDKRLETRRKQNIKGGLRIKITCPVVLTISIIVAITLFVGISYYQNVYKKQTVSAQKKQMDRVVYSLSTVQNTVNNVSKQVAVSEAVQDKISIPVKASAEYFVASDNIRNALGTYTFIVDYIREILIYTENGSTYSNYTFRGQFNPDSETWYQEFKESGEKKGYTSVHSSVISQNGKTADMLSYVLSYYSLSDYTQKLGDLIINLDYQSLKEMATMDMSLLEGYAVYNERGEQILGAGSIGQSWQELQNCETDQFSDEKGNIYLLSKDIGNSWTMVTEISGTLMNRQTRKMEAIIAAIFLVMISLILLALSRNIKKIVTPLNQLSLAAEKVGQGDLDVSVSIHTGDEVEVLANAFNKMVKDVQHSTEMSVQHEKALRQSQVDQLLLQINPHFIYNTLNSIVYMARIDGNKEIEQFVNAFISLLQNTLRVENAVYTSLGEELENVQNYLILQKYRYMDKFEEEICCPAELRTYLIPKVILQPIVENAIFHGIAPMSGTGKLKILAEIKEGKLQILVEDNGIGMSKEVVNDLLNGKEHHTGDMRKIGMANVYQRIREICGNDYGFRIESQTGIGTKVILSLPIVTKNNTEETEK